MSDGEAPASSGGSHFAEGETNRRGPAPGGRPRLLIAIDRFVTLVSLIAAPVYRRESREERKRKRKKKWRFLQGPSLLRADPRRRDFI